MMEWFIKALIRNVRSKTIPYAAGKAVFHSILSLIYGALSRIQGAEVGFDFSTITSSDRLSEFILWVPTVLNSAGLEVLVTSECCSFTEFKV